MDLFYRVRIIQEKLIQNFPLVNKIDSELNCYLLEKRRYLIFWNSLIEKDSIEGVLNYLKKETSLPIFPEFKTLIVIGKTKEEFKKNDLLYFDSVNTFVVFYLINEDKNEIYMNDSLIFAIGLNYKKYVRRINRILNK